MTEELHWLAIDSSALQYVLIVITLLAVFVNVLAKSVAVSVAIIALGVGTIITSATTTPNNYIMIASIVIIIGASIGGYIHATKG